MRRCPGQSPTRVPGSPWRRSTSFPVASPSACSGRRTPCPTSTATWSCGVSSATGFPFLAPSGASPSSREKPDPCAFHVERILAPLRNRGILRRETRRRRALEPVRGDYDFVLIGGPPSLGLLTLNALVAADRVLVPLQCEYYALEGLGSLLRTIELVRGSFNRDLALEGVVLTMFDARNNLAKQVMVDVQTNLPGQVYATIIPRNVRLSEAPSHGRPALLYDIESKGAQSYLALAGELLERRPAAAGSEERQRARP